MKWHVHLFIFLSIFFLFFYYIANYQNNYFIEYDIKIIQNDSNRWLGELYYSDHNSYHAQNRKQTRYHKDTYTFQHITETIKNIKPIHKLRFDPLLGKGHLEIKNFTIHYLNEKYQNTNKKYQIDFSKIANNYKNDLKIFRATKSGAILASTGNDPFFELSNTINFNTYTRHNAEEALIKASLLYLLIILVRLYSSIKVFSFGIFTLYTCYVLLFYYNVFALNLLIIFALASLFMVSLNNPSNLLSYTRHMGTYIFLYIIMGYLSLFITTEVANPNYFYTKIPLILLVFIVPIGFYNIKKFDYNFFKTMLTVLLIVMGVFIILLNHRIISVFDYHFYDKYYNFFNFLFKWTFWTQKNYTFWYLILMFGTLSFYDVRKKVDLIVVSSILILSYFAIFDGYSTSGKLSYSLGLFIYILLSFVQIQKRHLLIMTWVLPLLMIFLPLLLSSFDFSSNPKLLERITIYKTAFALIKEHWLFGYGYGSTLTIHIKDFVSIMNLPNPYIDTFPGGHPHNFSLLFWLDFGITGAIFLAYSIHKLLVYLVDNTYHTINQAAVLSLVVAFTIITSFSWSIWWPSVLLTFAFFGIMLTLSMNIKSPKSIVKT